MPPGEFIVLSHLLHDLRLYKSAHELKLMRRAAEITTGAHIRAMRTSRPGGTEAELEAELIHEFMRNGARFPAYPCIVGAGKNACVMHYVRNDAPLKDGDLVLIDAGCEYQYYASDVTRTFPVNGTFSAAQTRRVRNRAAGAARGDCDDEDAAPAFNVPHETAVRVMTEGLVELGLLDGDVDDLIANETLQKILRAQNLALARPRRARRRRLSRRRRVAHCSNPAWCSPSSRASICRTTTRCRRNSAASASASKTTCWSRATATKCSTAAAPKTVKDIEAVMREPIKPAPHGRPDL